MGLFSLGIPLAISAIGALAARKAGKSGAPAPSAQFSGARPPEVSFLRPVEKQVFEILSRRSLGQDVGFDPERQTKQTELLKSQLDRREEDEVRSALGDRFPCRTFWKHQGPGSP